MRKARKQKTRLTYPHDLDQQEQQQPAHKQHRPQDQERQPQSQPPGGVPGNDESARVGDPGNRYRHKEELEPGEEEHARGEGLGARAPERKGDGVDEYQDDEEDDCPDDGPPKLTESGGKRREM